ncbi:MAG: YkgJ family cysteine cluster protein [Deltaproteobacteria bacterium]|nr:YkgJ family cysteine cluster protein [Deltaproteobacteria bacterium]
MKVKHLYKCYDYLVDAADRAFQKIEEEYGECVKCDIHCTDCCHAVFGLFLIEALHLQKHFQRLANKEKKAALLRAEHFDQQLQAFQEKIVKANHSPEGKDSLLGSERIRCPLLSDELECILYPYRPITCRVYGIPSTIQGRSRVCGQSGFQSGRPYPTFKLDEINRELYLLSRKLLQEAGRSDLASASLLLSVSEVIRNPLDIYKFPSASDASSPTVLRSNAP